MTRINGFARVGMMGCLLTWAGAVLVGWEARGDDPPSEAEVVAVGDDAEMQSLMQQEAQLAQLASSTQDPMQATQYNLQIADVLVQIINHVKPEQRASHIRELADCLSSAAMQAPSGMHTAHERLAGLRMQLEHSLPNSALAAYVAHRALEAEYVSQLQVQGSDYQQVQNRRNDRLVEFVLAYPRAKETPEVLMELGSVNESLGRPEHALHWYQELVRDFPTHALTPKAEGARNRLQLEGRTFALALPRFNAGDAVDDPFDMSELRGKVVLVYFWSADDPQTARNLGLLRDVRTHYGSKGLTLLCVNLDKTPDRAWSFMQINDPQEIHVFQRGGMDGRVATRYGLVSLPTLLVVGRDGHVLSRGIDILSVETELAKWLR